MPNIAHKRKNIWKSKSSSWFMLVQGAWPWESKCQWLNLQCLWHQWAIQAQIIWRLGCGVPLITVEWFPYNNDQSFEWYLWVPCLRSYPHCVWCLGPTYADIISHPISVRWSACILMIGLSTKAEWWFQFPGSSPVFFHIILCPDGPSALCKPVLILVYVCNDVW